MNKKFFESKNTPYRVPETFYDDFRESLSARIREENNRRRSKILRIISSGAAAVLIVVTTTIAITESRQHQLHERKMAALAESPEKYMLQMLQQELQPFLDAMLLALSLYALFLLS